MYFNYVLRREERDVVDVTQSLVITIVVVIVAVPTMIVERGLSSRRFVRGVRGTVQRRGARTKLDGHTYESNKFMYSNYV